MTDYYYSGKMPAHIWEEILQRHWTFLDTEDGMKKLEDRKKIEVCLKEFLSIVPHDRKFFLPDTMIVLKKSIKEMDEFSAYKAMIGFESISQYANNLFTKPWRKEFKVIKMYSGFYQHEIQSNLVDAEILFKAMGYRQLPNQLLVLDGPICPDQVTNVSRDGMAAFVECKIMKNILSGLKSYGFKCSWLEIYNFRETHVCNQQQSIKAMISAFQERKYRKEQQISQENCYGPLQQPLQLHSQQFNKQNTNNCPTCCTANQHINCHQAMQSQLNDIHNNGGMNYCQMHGINNMTVMPTHQTISQEMQKHNVMCNMHTKQPQHLSHPQNSAYYNNVPVSLGNNHGYSQMTHSKSLEHYAEPTSTIPNTFTRHSFDHYDCVDGGGNSHQNFNYNSYNQQPFNVSGNRHSIPYHISNQFSNNQTPYGHCQQQQQPEILPQQSLTSSMSHNYYAGNIGPKMIIPNDQNQIYNEQQYWKNNKTKSTNDTIGMVPYHQNMDTNSCTLHAHGNGSNIISDNEIITNQSLTDHQFNVPNEEIMDLCNKNDYDNLLDQHQKQINQNKKNNIDKYSNRISQSQAILEQSQKIYDNNGRQLKNTSIMRGGNEHMLNDSHNLSGVVGVNRDIGGILSSSNDSTTSTTTSQNKNQDGVGSFESWNYVFQNLEKSGYTKDLGERGDLVVQGLDLDSIKLNSEKRKSREISQQQQQQQQQQSTNSSTSQSVTPIQTIKINENSSTRLSKNLDKIDQTILPNKKMDKQSTIKSNGHVNYGKGRDYNGIVDAPIPSGISNGGNSSAHNNTNNKAQKKSNKKTINNNDSTDKLKKYEWSCHACTFINPERIRICEMCSRTKDFKLDTKK